MQRNSKNGSFTGVQADLEGMIAHSQDIEPTLRELIEWQAKINEGYVMN